MKKFNPDAYLSGLNIDVMRFGLESITSVMASFGRPQKDYPAILIAGTNGKGSTAAMTASMLRQAGYRVGLYTSPHLVDVRERIVVNGRKIPRQAFSDILLEIKDRVDQPVTYFEVLTAAAFIYFQRSRIDIAVLEVGLGGRLDATNICRPLVSVITNISLEHTAYLGKTLAAIAGEKAGIIKKNGICVTAVRQKKVADVIAGVCGERRAKLFRLGKDFKLQVDRTGQVTYTGMHRSVRDLVLPLLGLHQRDNAALALAALEILNQKGYRIDDSAIRRGLLQTRWAARLEILHADPLFLLDGAHNPAGIASLCRLLEKNFPERRVILIFSALADKNYRRMLIRIGSHAAHVFLPPLKTNRAVAPEVLADVLQGMNGPVRVFAGVKDAVEEALRIAGKNDLICACGSLYLAGEIKQLFPEIICCDKKPCCKSREGV